MIQDLARALHLNPTWFYTLVLATLLIVALALGFILNQVFHRAAEKLPDTWGGFFFSLLESLPLPLLLLAALYTSLEVLTLPRRVERVGSKLIFALVVIVVFYFPAKVLIVFLRRLSRKEAGLEPVTQPAVFIVRALFAVLGIIIILENLGVSLTAVWTTLGVGSIAVALALQETLSNFFAGLYLLADRPVAPGNYVKLDSGQEGFVVRIGWRSTSLRTLSNNTVVVPNSALAKAVITNFSLPEPRMAVSIQVSVAYGTDVGQVERVLLEIADDAIRDGLEGLLAVPAPSVGLAPGFGASSLDFTLGVTVAQFTAQFLVQSELRKRIVERFRKEGIEIPFPTRTLLLDKSAGAEVHSPE
jgi:small-conductance mechanosensitive channel